MPRVRDLLYRFRPLGSPGSATRAGVPVDRERGLAQELEPVFAALASTLADCRATVEQGRRQAAQTRARNGVAVEQLLATSGARAAAARAAATVQVQATVTSQAEGLDVLTQTQLAQLRARLEERLPSYREQVAASVESLLTLGPESRVESGASS
jgi:DNA anti-recombination protein RmuC